MDPYTSAALVTGGAQIAGGFLQNEMNLTNASSANEWQGDQIRSGRAFTERMSNTAHQREVIDLKAAGLNPILSSSAGASTPSAGGGTPAVAHADNILNPAIATAMEIKRMNNEMEKQKAEIKLMDQQARKSATEKALLEKQIPQAEAKSQLWQLPAEALKKFNDARSSTAPKQQQFSVHGFDEKTKTFNIRKP